MHGKQMIGTGCEIDKETSKVHKTDNKINVGEYRRGNDEWTGTWHKPSQNKTTKQTNHTKNNNKYQINNNT